MLGTMVIEHFSFITNYLYSKLQLPLFAHCLRKSGRGRLVEYSICLEHTPFPSVP